MLLTNVAKDAANRFPLVKRGACGRHTKDRRADLRS